MKTWYTYDSISLNSLKDEKYSKQMLNRKSKHKFYAQYFRFALLRYKINVE